MRKQTKEVKIGKIAIGGNNPIAVQSMLNRRLSDLDGAIEQAMALKHAGCDIIRTAVRSEEDAKHLLILRNKVELPIVADIQFDYKLAIMSAEYGADKLRINPGNIGDPEKVKAVVQAASKRGIPIRIGVNSGSLDKDLLYKYGHPTAEAICESALRQVAMLERYDFSDIVVSLKSSDVLQMVEAYRLFSSQSNYPVHLGVTEAGTLLKGSIKSAMGFSILLSEGIGDTIRVSLTEDPVHEVRIARQILLGLHLDNRAVELISCPTCGRTQVDMIPLAKEVEKLIDPIPYHLKIAVMGCAVNGPGEAREADLGVACGVKEGVIFSKGQILKTVPEDQILPEMKILIQKMLKDKYHVDYNF